MNNLGDRVRELIEAGKVNEETPYTSAEVAMIMNDREFRKASLYREVLSDLEEFLTPMAVRIKERCGESGEQLGETIKSSIVGLQSMMDVLMYTDVMQRCGIEDKTAASILDNDQDRLLDKGFLKMAECVRKDIKN